MVYCRSGCGDDQRIIRSARVLACTICLVMGLQLGASEVAIADSMLSALTFKIVKSYDFFFAAHAAKGIRRLWSRTPGATPVGPLYALAQRGGFIDPAPSAIDPEPGPGVSTPGTSSAVQDSLRSFAESLEHMAVVGEAADIQQRSLRSLEADPSLAGNWGTAALMALSDPLLDVQDRFAAADSPHTDAEPATAPVLAAGTAADPADGAALPTLLRMVATAVESVAILVFGRMSLQR